MSKQTSIDSYLEGFSAYLRLEEHLSPASIEAYLHDVRLFLGFYRGESRDLPAQGESSPCAGSGFAALTRFQVEDFLRCLLETGLSARSQARVLSGIKSFFNYLVLEKVLERSPAELVESPKLEHRLPDVLSVGEIEKIFSAADLSTLEGRRDRAILELLYACGLRVSELVALRIPMLYFKEGFVRVTGKGDKERLVPAGRTALAHVRRYIEQDRCHAVPKKGCEDIVFLNRYGAGLSRVSVFKMVKRLAAAAGIGKNVSPHTFRHSFATHLIEGGADLRAVQDMLGHESITTTEIYTHLDRRYLQETIRKYHPLSVARTHGKKG